MSIEGASNFEGGESEIPSNHRRGETENKSVETGKEAPTLETYIKEHGKIVAMRDELEAKFGHDFLNEKGMIIESRIDGTVMLNGFRIDLKYVDQDGNVVQVRSDKPEKITGYDEGDPRGKALIFQRLKDFGLYGPDSLYFEQKASREAREEAWSSDPRREHGAKFSAVFKGRAIKQTLPKEYTQAEESEKDVSDDMHVRAEDLKKKLAKVLAAKQKGSGTRKFF